MGRGLQVEVLGLEERTLRFIVEAEPGDGGKNIDLAKVPHSKSMPRCCYGSFSGFLQSKGFFCSNRRKSVTRRDKKVEHYAVNYEEPVSH